ncbi:MAG: Cytochrome c-type biosis protein DsbD [Myxococcaceae bacterium]|nr:Cytochrome c-type biosis protein DsbD [Myxococcaceae bacterium]
MRTATALRRLVAPLSLALLALPATAHADDLFSTALHRYGLTVALASAFVVGLMTAATPCVYPMIAITVSVFGARRETRGRAMWLSTAFVLGLAALFVPLGLFAGLTGTVAGRLAGSAWVQGFEALLMFGMALNMFGLFEISLPSSLQDRLSLVGGLGARGAFLIGFATGPIAAPCATAGLVGILDYVFQQRDVTGGGLALFSYSLGLGLPFWLVGSLSLGLPKPGLWMDRVKSVFGVVLMVLAFYYLRHILPLFAAPPRGLPTSSWFFAAIVVAGLALGAVHLSLKNGTPTQRGRKALGVALAALGGVWLVAYEPPAPAIAWVAPTPDLAALARARHQPVLVDFGATWCAACEELLQHTFSDAAVRQEARRFVTVRVDATESTPALDALQARHHVRGLPTVLLLDATGREVARVAEFVPATRMLQLMQGVN